MDKEKLIKEAAEKVANKAQASKSLAKTLGNAFLIGATATAVGRLTDLLIKEIEKKTQDVKSKEYYKKMLEAHPQLQNEDPAIVAQYWASLRHFAPSMAEDPLAAGAYITQSIRRYSGEELGGPPPETYNTLSSISKNLRNEKQPGMGTEIGREVAKNTTGEVIKGNVSGVF